jgi:hypothetical protein
LNTLTHFDTAIPRLVVNVTGGNECFLARLEVFAGASCANDHTGNTAGVDFVGGMEDTGKIYPHSPPSQQHKGRLKTSINKMILI